MPRKNIMDFEGRPMIEWTISAALSSEKFDHVLVSTDDPEIAEIGLACGAEVPFLREKAQDDYSPVSEATIHSLDQAEHYWDCQFDTVTQLMPNCPLRGTKDIITMYDFFKEERLNFLISAFRFGWMNPWWAYVIEKDGTPSPMFSDAVSSRSQDLPETYCPSGALWLADCVALRESNTYYGPGFRLYPMDWKAAIDIDNQDDFDMARAVSALM